MKKIAVLLTGLLMGGSVEAEPRPLPPIINNSSYANGAAYANRTPSSQPILEMLNRLEGLQNQVRQLRGLLEQQNHEILNLKKRQQNIYADVNIRLQQLETGRTLITNSAGKEKLAIPAAVKRTSHKRKVPRKSIKKVKPKSAEYEKADFDEAYASVRNSRYHQAIRLLNQFIVNYPKGKYSDNALFWLGSVYKVVKDTPAAKKNFKAVFMQFPKSEKAALAMLKLADIYLAEKKLSKAKQLYMRVKKDYPSTSAARVAENKLQSIGQ